MAFRAWAHERVPLNSQWLTQDWWRRFPPLLVANSIWLERAESLITKQ